MFASSRRRRARIALIAWVDSATRLPFAGHPRLRPCFAVLAIAFGGLLGFADRFGKLQENPALQPITVPAQSALTRSVLALRISCWPSKRDGRLRHADYRPQDQTSVATAVR